MPEIQQARPPYVQFELRAVEDRAASQDAGHYVAKDVAYAIITPAGSRDRIEKIAEEWLRDMGEQVRQERLPIEWHRHYQTIYAAWKEGREAPETGTSIRQWPVVSPAQVELLINLRIRTVEDLAAANEEAIARMGMGGRALKQKAVDWLASASGIGKNVEVTAALRAENETLKLEIDRLKTAVASLERSLLHAAQAPGGGGFEPGEDDDGDIKLDVRPTASMKKL